MTDPSRTSQHREPAVSERLFRDFAGSLSGFMRARVRDAAIADDLVQEVFLRIHRSHGELRDGERVAGWVFRIARNVLADHYRRGDGRRDRESSGDPAGILEGVAHGGRDPEEEGALIQRRQLGLWLAATIQSLPSPYDEALTLVELEGLSQKEAAERLGLSHSGFKSRVQRGRALLRGALSRCCDVELDRSGRVIDYRERSRQSGGSADSADSAKSSGSCGSAGSSGSGCCP